MAARAGDLDHFLDNAKQLYDGLVNIGNEFLSQAAQDVGCETEVIGFQFCASTRAVRAGNLR